MNNTLGLVLPTNNPDAMDKFILSSLHYFSEVKEFCTFLLNFQSPYTMDKVAEVLDKIQSAGFSYKSTFSTYEIAGKGLIPVAKIRNDTARLDTSCKFYALIDDDMEFRGISAKINKTAGHQYLDIIRYMLEFEKCGTLLVGGSMYKTIPTNHIGMVDIYNTYLTSKGFIVRNLHPYAYIVPVDAEWVLGSDEEKIAAGARLSKGLFTAKMRMGRVLHYENYNRGKKSGSDLNDWNNFDIVENNATKYIRENFNSDFKGNKMAIGGQNYYNLVKWEDYYKAGGIEFNEENQAKYLVDYSNSTVEGNSLIIKDLLREVGDKS